MAIANTDGSSETWLKWRCLYGFGDRPVVDQETCGKAIYRQTCTSSNLYISNSLIVHYWLFEMPLLYHKVDRVLSEVFLESVLPKLLTSVEEDLCSQLSDHRDQAFRDVPTIPESFSHILAIFGQMAMESKKQKNRPLFDTVLFVSICGISDPILRRVPNPETSLELFNFSPVRRH